MRKYSDYIAKVINKYGTKCFVCFDGYINLTLSTRVAEQNRITDQNISPDIFIDLPIAVTSNLHSFWANCSNKSRLINKLKVKLTDAGVACCKSQAGADYLIRITVLDHDPTSSTWGIGNGSVCGHNRQYARESVYSIHNIK